MLTICKRLGLAVALFSATASGQIWQFAGTTYNVITDGDAVQVVLKREHAQHKKVVGDQCIAALSLPFRQQAENELITQGFITKVHDDNWPLSSVNFKSQQVRLEEVSTLDAVCRAKIEPAPLSPELLSQNLLRYAGLYTSQKDWSSLKPLLSHLLKDRSVANEAAAMTTLMLADVSPDNALSYQRKYVDVGTVTSVTIREMLAKWHYDAERLDDAVEWASDCDSKLCLDIRDSVALIQAEQNSADVFDLNSFLN
ncbi:hypothetical protein LRP49_06355 [Enterovibrio sp. ZSDZ35]|uniref:TraB/GumN family protein n=1 Tax=Enterovibrio qingdaonensis TaxID=2899818 RepID=A0ABT5QIL1_9GAMM|nr:hypothetical protein [Enterovibrio sp. ZSDZ35]MDD1780820.1 hypothetical protein [Enterovibrio sp. ZSDZ35]